ncbi:hypothetical protein HMPREF9349_03483 [Escherichia coli MS 79-10]|nr:hypothetical protein HMPREF9349_03483 [Escherichia coli MS 79-10]
MLPLTEQGSPVDESNGRPRNSARIPALRHTREEVDMVVAGQQRSWIDCCISQPR